MFVCMHVCMYVCMSVAGLHLKYTGLVLACATHIASVMEVEINER